MRLRSFAAALSPNSAALVSHGTLPTIGYQCSRKHGGSIISFSAVHTSGISPMSSPIYVSRVSGKSSSSIISRIG